MAPRLPPFIFHPARPLTLSPSAYIRVHLRLVSVFGPIRVHSRFLGLRFAPIPRLRDYIVFSPEMLRGKRFRLRPIPPL
jgi:hypothetical protein